MAYFKMCKMQISTELCDMCRYPCTLPYRTRMLCDGRSVIDG